MSEIKKHYRHFELVIIVLGISGLVAQILLLREFFIIFSGNELSIGIILANWLILEAFGCFFLGRRAEDIKHKIEIFVLITVVFSVSLPTAIYLIRSLKGILGVSIGERIGFLTTLWTSFIIIAPVAITHGTLFTFGCKIWSIYSTDGVRSVGRVYIYETGGTIIGGIVINYLLITHFNTFLIASGLTFLNLLISLSLIKQFYQANIGQKVITGTLCILLILSGYLTFFGGAGKLHHHSIKIQWRKHNVVHYENSIYGNICVIQSEGQYTFFYNGIPYITTPIPNITFVQEFAHLPMFAHPNPKRVLILSSGVGGVINEILKHPSVEKVEYAEIDPLIIKLTELFSTPLSEKELNDSRVEINYIDGRLFLKITPSKYDIIFVGLLDPSDLQTNRFFTREFFYLAKNKLNDEGILVIGLPGSLSYLNDELKNLNGCIYKTLKDIFPYVRVFPGDGVNFFLSSESMNVFINEQEIIRRVKKHYPSTDQTIPWYIEQKFHPGWQDWFLKSIEGHTRKTNQDFSPIGMFYSIAYWNTRFSPYLRGLFKLFEKIDLLLVIFLFSGFIAAFLLFRLRYQNFPLIVVPFCITATGFAGMIFDLVLIFAFQSIYGYVFHWLGFLVTAFMTGVVVGGGIMTFLLPKIKRDIYVFTGIELALFCLSIALLFTFLLYQHLDYLSTSILQILFLALSFLSGVLIGSEFPLANKIYLKNNPNLSKSAGLLYGCDLLGGWLGGIIGGILLLPILGIVGTCLGVAILKLGTFIIALKEGIKYQGG